MCVHAVAASSSISFCFIMYTLGKVNDTKMAMYTSVRKWNQLPTLAMKYSANATFTDSFKSEPTNTLYMKARALLRTPTDFSATPRAISSVSSILGIGGCPLPMIVETLDQIVVTMTEKRRVLA